MTIRFATWNLLAISPRSRRRSRAKGAVRLEDLLRRRRFRHPGGAVLIVLLLALLIWADRSGLLLDVPGADPATAYDGQTFIVTRVVDGDTLEVRPIDALIGDATRVRLWGIDTPEMFRRPEDGGTGGPDPFAEEATAMTRKLCEGATVRLRIERHRVFDRYDRLLAHVELADGTLLSEHLLLAGLARADDRWNHTHIERFQLLETTARMKRVGLWSLQESQQNGTRR